MRTLRLLPVVLSLSVAGCGGSTAANVGAPLAADQSERLLPQAFAIADAPPAFTEFSSNLPSSHTPSSITLGPDGAMWFVDSIDPDFGSTFIGRIDSTGTVKKFFYQNAQLSFPSVSGIVTGPDGNLWMSDSGDEVITRMTPAGKITVFTLPGPAAFPAAITVGPDKNVWFVDNGSNSVDSITTNGQLNIYHAAFDRFQNFQDITSGSDGNLWFTEYATNRIGRMSTGGTVAQFSTGISPNAHLGGIVSGPGNALWFTEYSGAIGRITTSGVVTEFRNGITSGEHPVWIASSANGNLWFTERGPGGSRIARITTKGNITEFTPPFGGTDYFGIAPGVGDTEWFTIIYGDHIGLVTY